jgi:hypothetical protein
MSSEQMPRSRRALLTGALGGLGALVASAIGRATPVRAEGEAMVVGGDYLDATSMTYLFNQANGNDVFMASTNSSGTGVRGASYSGIGVRGDSTTQVGVQGFSNSSRGVYGASYSSTGVSGNSTVGDGVEGDSDAHWGVVGVSNQSVGVFGRGFAANGPGTVGQNVASGTGVLGVSADGVNDTFPAAKAKTGVYGYAAQDGFSRGVTGESPAGIGVYGISSTGYGGYFAGKVYTTRWYELTEISTPPTPVANRARLFIKDDGFGKTQVCVKFANGTVKVLATEG